MQIISYILNKLVLLSFLLGAVSLTGQDRPVKDLKDAKNESIEQDTTKEGFIIMDADRSVFFNKKDTVRQMLIGNFKAVQDSTYMYADSAEFFNNTIKAMSNVVVLQGDTVRLFCDSLYYDGDTSIAYMYDNVILENGDQRLFTDRLVYLANSKVAYYYDTAYLQQGSSVLQSLKGVFDIENEISDYYEHVTLKDNGLTLRSDSLRFYNTLKKAVFKAPTRITKDDIQIYCEDGFYDIDDSIGVFKINAQFINGDTKALADTIFYDGNTNSIRLVGNAFYTSGADSAYADVIEYDEVSGNTYLRGNAQYFGESRQAEGRVIFFNEKTEDFKVEGESTIVDGGNIIKGEEITFDKVSGIGSADGSVVFIDTSNHALITSDHLDYKDADEFFMAYNVDGKPVYSQKVDTDSMHISADTLKSFRRLILRDTSSRKKRPILNPVSLDSTANLLGIDSSLTEMDSLSITVNDTTEIFIVPDTVEAELLKDTVQLTGLKDTIGNIEIVDTLVSSSIDSSMFVTDTLNYIVADGNVEIFKKDLQAVCDTMSYGRSDSIFTLIGRPVMWSDSTQFTGDTIKMYMVNDEIDHVEILDEALIISTTDLVYYSQIKGRRIDAYFVDSKIDSMVVTGNAQCVYYMQDKEDAYIGVNTTECSRIVFLFENDEISDIKFYKDADSHIIPMKKADHEGLKLEGFDWQINRRPKSPRDLRA